uniref:Uncharacterized protein n=1 Tax=Dicentrarchus labrax TaxID=13489 RepID=A0A8C4DBE7_DICLA
LYCKISSICFCIPPPFLGLCLLQLGDAGCGLGAHDAASPVTTDLEKNTIGLDGFHKLGKCTFILTRREEI